MQRGFVIVAACLILTGVAVAASNDDPFRINKRDFKKQYATIALTPVDSDPYLQMPDSVAAMIEQEVTARLQKRGYTVIPSSVLTEIRRSMESQVGGIEDPESGKVSLAKQRAVRDHAFRELWFRQQFDALANIRVSITQVPMESDRVEWDGTTQKISYEGRSKKYSASISVISVSVGVYDDSNKLLFLNYGGLEPLMRRQAEQLVAVDPGQLFRDEKRIRNAAKIAVKPF